MADPPKDNASALGEFQKYLPGWGGLNSKASVWNPFEKALNQHEPTQNTAQLFLNAVKDAFLDPTQTSHTGPYLGICFYSSVPRDKVPINSTQREVNKKSTNVKTYVIKAWVPELSPTACLPRYLPSDDKNWLPEDWSEIHKLPVFVGNRAIGDPGFRQPKIGDIVAVDFDVPSMPSKGGTYLGIAYDSHGAYKSPVSREALDIINNDFIEPQVKNAPNEEKILCIEEPILTGVGGGNNERSCQVFNGEKKCELSTGKRSFKARGPNSKLSDYMRNTGPGPGNQGGYGKPFSGTNLQFLAYQSICAKAYGGKIGWSDRSKLFYDQGKGGLYKNDKSRQPQIIKKIVLDGSPVFENSSSRTLFVHWRLELLFKMVFRNLALLHNTEEKQWAAQLPSIKKFRIKKTLTHRNVEAVRERLEQDTPNIFRWKIKKVGNQIKIIDKKAKTGTKGSEENPHNYPYKISSHSFGAGIDINPEHNPMLPTNQESMQNMSDWMGKQREESESSNKSYMLPDSVVSLFKSYGFRWLGDNSELLDMMHFDFIGDPTLILTSYINGIIYAIENKNSRFKASELLIGSSSQYWNRELNKILDAKGLSID